MDYIKGYVKSVGDFVSSVIDEPVDSTNPELNDLNKIEEKSEDSFTKPLVSPPETSTGLLDWIPKFKTPSGENPLLYCINSLASFGSESGPPEALRVLETKPTENVTQDRPSEDASSETAASASTNTETDKGPENVDLDSAFSNWLSGLSLKTEEVWKQMKHDLTEVVSVMSTEPKDAVTRTASSLRRQLSAAASAVGKMDPNRFTLLPESKQTGSGNESASSSAEPPLQSDVPSLETLRSDVGQLMSGIMSSLFGTDDKDRVAVKSKREARLHVLRADPATYELEPPLPPAHLGVHSYADWRAAYFDEVTCQPLPGIPIAAASDTTTAADKKTDPDDLLEPPHPSPEQLLEQNPFMRTYLSRLVTMSEPGGKGLTDADFWSRYYYRVWLLDVTEKRRQQLAARVDSIPRLHADRDGTSSLMFQDAVSCDWMNESDQETPVKTTHDATPPSTLNQTSAGHNVSEPSISAEPNSDKKGKRSKRKRANVDHGSKTATANLSPAAAVLVPKEALVSSKSPAAAAAAAATTVQTDKSLGAESDEPSPSVCSSLVVLSNGEDDLEMVSPAVDGCADKSAPTQPPSNSQPHALLVDVVSDRDSDDWGIVSEEESTELIVTKPQNQASSTIENDERSPDWDDWS